MKKFPFIHSLTLTSLIFLLGCGNSYNVELPPPTNNPAPIDPEIPVDTTPYCKDFNSLNRNQELPCVCPPDYIVSEDTKSCVDKTEFAHIKIITENLDPIDSKEDYRNATFEIDADLVNPDWSTNLTGQIRGRGNSTWAFPKKPYKIKLSSKSSVMGMPSDKEWVLLANYSDKTLLRNMIALEMAKRLGMPWTPRYKVVEVTVNNEYQGVYLLTEQVKVAKNRVDIDEDNDYLIEFDIRGDGDNWFSSMANDTYVIKSPKTVSPEQIDDIRIYFSQIDQLLRGPDIDDPVIGYSSYIDVDSFIDWYLVNEVLKNPDGADISSIFFTKKSGEKLKMGPIWDFDISLGNVYDMDISPPQGWWIRWHSRWFYYLFTDYLFEQKVMNRYKVFAEKGIDKESLLTLIDQKAESIQLAQERNFAKWDILNIWVWPNFAVHGSYQGEIDYLKDWLTQRMDWIDSKLNRP